jgi:hypothetical protein
MRPTVIVLCAAVLAVSGLTARKATRSASPATTPTTQSAALDGWVQPGSANLVDVGGGSQAAVLGTGPVGVVLSNQSDQNLCGWLPFANTLAARGFRVLVYDYGTAADPAASSASAHCSPRTIRVERRWSGEASSVMASGWTACRYGLQSRKRFGRQAVHAMISAL